MTTRTIDTPVNQTWGLDPLLSIWVSYLLDEDGNNICDNEGNRICVYADAGHIEIPGTIRTIDA